MFHSCLSMFKVGAFLMSVCLTVGTEEFLFCRLMRMMPVKHAALLLSCPLSHKLFPHPVDVRVELIFLPLLKPARLCVSYQTCV